jgi:hypothetical protein
VLELKESRKPVKITLKNLVGTPAKRREDFMKNKGLIGFLTGLMFMVLAGCATVGTIEHKYSMKGQVLDVSNGVVYLCIGSSEGAQPGQEFSVYRHTKIPGTGVKGEPLFNRELVGKVKINEVVHEHYANASIVSGDIKVNDVAELNP